VLSLQPDGGSTCTTPRKRAGVPLRRSSRTFCTQHGGDRSGIGGSRCRDPTTCTFLTSRDPLDGIDGTPTVANPYHYVDNNPINKTDPLGLRPNECSFKDEAIALSVEDRQAAMRSFVGRNEAVSAYENATPHVSGLMAFTQWEVDSGRLSNTGGSAWWRAVNGGMMLDIRAAGKLIRSNGLSARSSDPNIQAWIDYQVSARSGGQATTQRALWRAHQLSLHRGVDCFDDLLAREEGSEQEFIKHVVENVDITALLNFPSDEWGAMTIGAVGKSLPLVWPSFYPDYGDVTWDRARQASIALLLPDFKSYAALVGANILGLDSGWYWKQWR